MRRSRRRSGDTPPPLQNSNSFKVRYKITKKICHRHTPTPANHLGKKFDPHLHRSWQFYNFIVNKYMLTTLAKITGTFFGFSAINSIYNKLIELMTPVVMVL